LSACIDGTTCPLGYRQTARAYPQCWPAGKRSDPTDTYHASVTLGVASQALSVARHVWQHPANRGQRSAALCRAVAFQCRGRAGRRTLARIGRRSSMWAELHYTGSSSVVYANPPDWNEMQAWRRLLGPGDLFVDVGSNVGSYALWVAELGVRVVAVEPSSSAADRLTENVALNGADVDVLRCALAAAPGRMPLTRDLDTVNHLVVHGPVAAAHEEVEVRTLDDVLAGRAAAGVKVDVEGAERLVLQGARQALSDGRIGVLQLEWNAMSERVLGEDRTPVAALLGSYGYSLHRPDAKGVLRPVPRPAYGPDVFAVARSRILPGSWS
jgi:FkbM family methyltransferase